MKKILMILLLMVAAPFVSTVSDQEKSSHEWDVGGPDITPPESV